MSNNLALRTNKYSTGSESDQNFFTYFVRYPIPTVIAKMTFKHLLEKRTSIFIEM